MYVSPNFKTKKALREALEEVITAAEIIDGQDSPPAEEDTEHLHKTISRARAVLAKA